MSEHELEPVHGLPEQLPQGEHIVWQGQPVTGALAKSVFRIRALIVYFGALAAWPLGSALLAGKPMLESLSVVGWLAVLGASCLGLLTLLASLMARTAVYTITNKRVVLRIGVALSMSINIPFAVIEIAALGLRPDGTGDIALRLRGRRLGYVTLWPHARPWYLRHPEPTLRSIPDARRVSLLLAEQLARESEPGPAVIAETAMGESPPDFTENRTFAVAVG